MDSDLAVGIDGSHIRITGGVSHRTDSTGDLQLKGLIAVGLLHLVSTEGDALGTLGVDGQHIAGGGLGVNTFSRGSCGNGRCANTLNGNFAGGCVHFGNISIIGNVGDCGHRTLSRLSEGDCTLDLGDGALGKGQGLRRRVDRQLTAHTGLLIIAHSGCRCDDLRSTGADNGDHSGHGIHNGHSGIRAGISDHAALNGTGGLQFKGFVAAGPGHSLLHNQRLPEQIALAADHGTGAAQLQLAAHHTVGGIGNTGQHTIVINGGLAVHHDHIPHDPASHGAGGIDGDIMLTDFKGQFHLLAVILGAYTGDLLAIQQNHGTQIRITQHPVGQGHGDLSASDAQEVFCPNGQILIGDSGIGAQDLLKPSALVCDYGSRGAIQLDMDGTVGIGNTADSHTAVIETARLGRGQH